LKIISEKKTILYSKELKYDIKDKSIYYRITDQEVEIVYDYNWRVG